jgi:DNA-binding NtrC family response regulator
MLMQHPWPGNVRELENCLTRAVVLAPGSVIRPEHLTNSPLSLQPVDQLCTLAEVARQHVTRVLAATGNHKAKSAEILGVSRPTLNRLMRVYGLE